MSARLRLGVNVDHERAAAMKFLEKYPADFPLVYDTEGKVAARYKLQGMPSAVILDREGRERDEWCDTATQTSPGPGGCGGDHVPSWVDGRPRSTTGTSGRPIPRIGDRHARIARKIVDRDATRARASAICDNRHC